MDQDVRTKLLVLHEEDGKREQWMAWSAQWGYEPLPVETRAEVLEEISGFQTPWLALCSANVWSSMGPKVQALAGALPGSAPGFCIVAGPAELAPAASAQDYLIEPFRPSELQSRLNLANHIVALQRSRHVQAEQLQKARAQLHRLEGMLPICMDCKKIRDERNRWQPIERFIAARSKAAFTHGLCPACFQRRIEEMQPVG